MARARWGRDRQRRDALAALAPERTPDRIRRRIVVIDDERIVRETVIYAHDSRRAAAAKLRQVLVSPSASSPSSPSLDCRS